MKLTKPLIVAGAIGLALIASRASASAPATAEPSPPMSYAESIAPTLAQYPATISGYNTKSLLAGGRKDPFLEAEARKLEKDYIAMQRRMIAIKQSGNWNLDLYTAMSALKEKILQIREMNK